MHNTRQNRAHTRQLRSAGTADDISLSNVNGGAKAAKKGKPQKKTAPGGSKSKPKGTSKAQKANVCILLLISYCTVLNGLFERRHRKTLPVDLNPKPELFTQLLHLRLPPARNLLLQFRLPPPRKFNLLLHLRLPPPRKCNLLLRLRLPPLRKLKVLLMLCLLHTRKPKLLLPLRLPSPTKAN